MNARRPIAWRGLVAAAVGCSVLIGTGLVASADNVVNGIDATIDAAAEVMNLNVNGPNGTTSLRVDPTNSDGKNGCNLTGSTTLTVAVESSDAGVATVSPSSVVFNSCGATPGLVVTPHSVGSATVSLRLTGNTTDGTFDLAPATFTVNVAGPVAPTDPTAPVITPTIAGTLGTNGWYTSDVTVSWSVVDDESSIGSKNGCDSTTIGTDTAGTTLTCTATSAGGTSSQSVTIKRDATAPRISGSRSVDANANGWHNSPVTVSFSCEDELSGIASCSDATELGEGADQHVTGTAVDLAGNSTEATVSDINIDLTAPRISGSRSVAPNAYGWHNSAVTVSFSCEDDLSGIASCSDATELGEGSDQQVTGTAVDLAGNSAQATVSDIDVDLTAPSVALAGGPAAGGTYYWGYVPSAPSCTASDALSGLAGPCTVEGYSTAIGSHTVSASAADKAGNTGSSSATYTVNAWTLTGFSQPVDMGDRMNVVKGGSTVPMKFEAFAGSLELTDPSVVKSFTQSKVACSDGKVEDTIEATTTGGTSLRYDATGGQFIQNWKTPTGAGSCYKVTITTQDGSSLNAFFKLK